MNFKNFIGCHKIQRAVLTAIAVQASADDIKAHRELFMDLDRQGEGYLSFSQFQKGLAPIEKDKELLRKMFDAMDTDMSGFVDYSEFLAAAIPQSLYLREDYLLTAFNMFDQDDSGKIDLVELSMILQGKNDKE